jgi:hypothetical protein
MKYIFYISIICFGFSITSCEKDIPFPEQDVEPRIVVNATFSTDSLWKVHLSKSAPVNQVGTPEDITDGSVIIKKETGETIATLSHQANGFYTAEGSPSSGQRYTIEAQAPGLQSVSASSYQPKPFSFSFVDSTRSTYLDFPVVFIDLEIEDNADEENYYLIQVTQLIELPEEDYSFEFLPNHFVFDQNTENVDINSDNGFFERIYLPDAAFNGEKYTTRFAVGTDVIDNEIDGEYTFLISVSSVSSDLYKYTKTLETYEYSNGELFSEPVEIFNNIENGLGIWGGEITKEYLLEF